MKEIGAILKAAREEKGLSLDEIQMATKIRYKHLEAMEAGEFDQLPGEVYVKGFLGNYAKMVGLEAEEILRKYLALKISLPQPNRKGKRWIKRRSGRQRSLRKRFLNNAQSRRKKHLGWHWPVLACW